MIELVGVAYVTIGTMLALRAHTCRYGIVIAFAAYIGIVLAWPPVLLIKTVEWYLWKNLDVNHDNARFWRPVKSNFAQSTKSD